MDARPPFGGVDRRGSTSPFCIGVPLDDPAIVRDGVPAYLNGYAALPLVGGLIEQPADSGADAFFTIHNSDGGERPERSETSDRSD